METSKYFRSTSANEAFIALAETIYNRPQFTVAPRGEQTREALAVNVTITDPYSRYITHPARKFSLKYAIAEWLWYRRGSNSLEEIAHYAKFWNKVSDDGMTVNSAYGYRLLGNHPQVPVNQWEYVKQELVRDPSSRRAVMLILSPFDLRVTKDLPCTAYLQFFIRNDQLYLAVNMRSNDLVLGFANDVFAFTLFQEQMLLELQATYPMLQMGEYYHFAGSMHIYERNFPMIESVLHEPKLSNDLTLPHMADLSQIDNLQEIEALLRRGEPTDAVHLSDPFSLACAAALHD